MVANRLKELIHILNENPNSFAQKIGAAGTVIYNIIGRRKSNPSFELLEKIKQAYPSVNVNWLIDGTGIPLLEAQESELSVQVKELTKRMEEIEKLANLKDSYIALLQERVGTLKSQVVASKEGH